VDLLYDHLTRARACGAVFARTVAEPPWGLRLAGSIPLAVHTVVRGRAWLWLGDDPGSAVELSPGDVTLVRGGPDHYIGHEPGADCLEPEEFRARHGQDGRTDDPRATVFLCGAYRFSGDIGSGLLDANAATLAVPCDAAPNPGLPSGGLLIGILSKPAPVACANRGLRPADGFARAQYPVLFGSPLQWIDPLFGGIFWSLLTWDTLVWNSVAWDNFAWDSVVWDSVAWDSVVWDSVAWDSVAWDSVAWDSVAWDTYTLD